MKTRKMFKTLLTVILACAMFLCPMLAAQADEAPAYKVAIIKQLDHASLDEIANAVAARLDEIAAVKSPPARATSRCSSSFPIRPSPTA